MLEFSPAMTDGGFPSSSPRLSTSRSQAQSKLPAIFWQQTIIHCAREMKVTTRRTTSWLIYRASNNRARQSAFAETDDDKLRRSLFSCFVGLSAQRCWNDILLIPFLADFTHRFLGWFHRNLVLWTAFLQHPKQLCESPSLESGCEKSSYDHCPEVSSWNRNLQNCFEEMRFSK